MLPQNLDIGDLVINYEGDKKSIGIVIFINSQIFKIKWANSFSGLAKEFNVSALGIIGRFDYWECVCRNNKI